MAETSSELREIAYKALYGKGGMGPDGAVVVESLLSAIAAAGLRIVPATDDPSVEQMLEVLLDRKVIVTFGKNHDETFTATCLVEPFVWRDGDATNWRDALREAYRQVVAE